MQTTETVRSAAPAASRDSAPAVPERPPVAWGIVGLLAAVKLVLHLATDAFTPYGIHRDELLYLAMGRHFHLWRMDFPPLIALAAQAERALAGDSLVSIRLLPTLAGTLILVLAALIARELGGGPFAQGVAALAVLCGLLFLRSASLFQPVVPDQLWWTLGLYALVRLCRTQRPGWWLAVGLACGAGFLTKFSILFFGAGLAGAILLTRHRRALLTPWPWMALVLALAIGSPSLVGQVRLGWPVLSSMADLRHTQLDRVTYADFLKGQALMVGPAILLAIAGLVSLLAGRLRAFRMVGWACVLPVLILMLMHGKEYYAGPVYPTLLAAGAVALEAFRVRGLAPGLRWAMAGSIVVLAAVTLPLGLPILAPERMAGYTDALGISALVNRNNHGGMERLPQDYADLLGWPQQVATLAAAYRALPPAERAQAVVWTGNYGEAAAVDFFGPRLGLPHAVSAAGTYWFFGPGDKPGAVLLAINTPERDLWAMGYTVVRQAGSSDYAWAVGEERHLPIYVVTGATSTLQAEWPRLAGRH
jgi:hypothetical protein